jgi:hypothetical protein
MNFHDIINMRPSIRYQVATVMFQRGRLNEDEFRRILESLSFRKAELEKAVEEFRPREVVAA